MDKSIINNFSLKIKYKIKYSCPIASVSKRPGSNGQFPDVIANKKSQAVA